MGDTATLRTLAADDNDNVVEAAVEALAKNGAHAFDDVYLVAIRRSGAQAVRAGAGRPASDDKPPTPEVKLPARSVALAMGEEVQLRAIMSPKTGGGSFVVRLRGDIAPLMAGKVLELVASGYYNGLSWHRVDPDFVIQGGSPGANEYVGDEAQAAGMLTWPHAGCHVHTAVWVPEDDRAFATRLARYCARNSVALERLTSDRTARP